VRPDADWPDDRIVLETMLRLTTVSRRAGRIVHDEDPSQWSDDVQLALHAYLRHVDTESRRLQAHPEALAQLALGERVRASRYARLDERHFYSWSPEEQQAGIAAAERAVERAVRFLARRQQRTRGGKLRSIVDGWRGLDGRPSKSGGSPWLLLRVQVWRDLRERTRPDVGRLRRSEALAELKLRELGDTDPVQHKRVKARQLQLEYDERLSPTAALTQAVKDIVGGDKFRALERQVAGPVTRKGSRAARKRGTARL
jgi:hypothetical protein